MKNNYFLCILVRTGGLLGGAERSLVPFVFCLFQSSINFPGDQASGAGRVV